MPLAESYLDLAIITNGMMDAFLLMVTGRVLHFPMKASRVAGAVLLGEIPVICLFYGPAYLLTIAKFITPAAMVWLAYRPKSWRILIKAILCFWLMSAGLGGFIYALWNWVQFQGAESAEKVRLVLSNFWVLPLGAFLWGVCQKSWWRWQKRFAFLSKKIYEVEIDFGKEGKTVKLQALVDTGNQLRDPITGAPVLLLEEKAVKDALPEEVLSVGQLPWQESPDPWVWLWKLDPKLMKTFVFIPFRAIRQKSWLLAVRPPKILILLDEGTVPIKATVAFVKEVLSSEGEFQALLHPELTGSRGEL